VAVGVAGTGNASASRGSPPACRAIKDDEFEQVRAAVGAEHEMTGRIFTYLLDHHEDAAHLTRAQHDHINFYGTYSFDLETELRRERDQPLRSPAA
jgi:hypothetical protein